MPRKYRYSYRVLIKEETLPALQELAAAAGFVNDAPGAKFGDPSPAALLDTLAAAYRRDPALVARTLAALGVRPEKKPAPPTTATAPPSP